LEPWEEESQLIAEGSSMFAVVEMDGVVGVVAMI
jgi:hypothetical protein